MDTRTILIVFGLLFDLVGGILLASEMIGVLGRIKNYNLKIRKEINATHAEVLKIGFIIAIIALAIIWLKIKPKKQKKFDLQEVWIYLLVIKFKISYDLLLFLENLTKKLGTERVLGFLGVIFLCLGFIFQAIVNFMKT